MNKLRLIALLLAPMAFAQTGAQQNTEAMNSSVSEKVDWPEFVNRSQPIWKKLPLKWQESPFLGNGWMGTMIFRGRDNKHELFIQAQHAAVTDHRLLGTGKGSGAYAQARFLIGNFVVTTVGEMEDCDWKLDLWNAELTGTIRTTRGTIFLRALVHTQDMITQVEMQCAGGESAKVEFRPIEALSPRALGRKDPEHTPIPADCLPLNPPCDFLERDGVKVCHQGLIAGGEYATAWTTESATTAAGEKTVLCFSIAQSYPGHTATDEAVKTLKQIATLDQEKWIQAHRDWWHAIYQRSFVSFSDPYWESFYWMQRYVMASCTRADRMLIDNVGPWFEPTGWPYATWNLNVQLSYWPFNSAGLDDLARSLPIHLSRQTASLINNVPEEYRKDSAGIGVGATESLEGSIGAPNPLKPKRGPVLGDLTWALHDVWLQYRYSMDESLLRDPIFPLLRRSINYYRHFLTTGPDGRLHLPTSNSPEYEDMGPDTNYDLSLLRWGCQTLLWINDHLQLNDPLVPQWKEILEKLVPYPGNDTDGYFIADGVPVTHGHRHYSHLLMIYPLYLVNIDQPGGRGQIEKCVEHWQSFNSGFFGFTYTGAASMYASLGDGDRALKSLNRFPRVLLPNALYQASCIESPLSAAQSIQEMLLQSWGETIRVFPALPTTWARTNFRDLRTEGAFSVSASSVNGRTEWVSVRSLAGEPFRIRPGLKGKVQISGSGAAHVKELEPGVYALKLAKGEEAVFSSGSGPGTVSPVADPEPYHFGLP